MKAPLRGSTGFATGRVAAVAAMLLGGLLAGLSPACTGEVGTLEPDGGRGGRGADSDDAPDDRRRPDARSDDAPASVPADDRSTPADAPPPGTPDAPVQATPDLPSGPEAGLPDAGLPDYPVPADAGPSSTRLTPRFAGETEAALGFHEYLPPGYGEGPLRPLLVFLHGVGENGDGSAERLPIVLRNGLAALIDRDQWPADRPFVVLSPQHPGEGCPSADEVRDFIAFGMTSYQIDPKRVYLTGLSCGAIGAWSYLGSNLGNQITAMVPIAGDGRGPWNQAMCRLGEVPLWAFHGDADPTVSPQGSIEPLTNLMGCPSPPRQEVRLTVYPGVGHDSWTRTYDLSAGNDIYAWMLGFVRP